MAGVLTPQYHIAADLLDTRMREAFAQNPRGELYRTLSVDKLMKMLRQNVDELELALKYDNDVEDKLADVGNYAAFILRNIIDPLRPAQTTEEQVQAQRAGEVLGWMNTVDPD